MKDKKHPQQKFEIPMILYEEPSSRAEKGISFPYIEIQKDKQMPPVLFIFEYKHTGEIEPDDRGRDAAIIDQIPHKYVDMEYLKERLSPEVNDQVRVALGMKPLKVAQKEGQQILNKVFARVGGLKEAAEMDRDTKLSEISQKKEQAS